MRQFVIVFILIAIFLPTDVLGQGDSDTSRIPSLEDKILEYKEMESLPIELTPEEMTRLDEIGIRHKLTAPPPGPARNPAEWEPMTGALIRWPLGISVALIAEMSEDLEVYTIVADSSEQDSATFDYQSGGVNMDNVYFILAPTNSIWTRDYGPWFIFNGDGTQGIVDHIYNRPRPDDDSIPQVIGAEWKIPVYGMDLGHVDIHPLGLC
jgi:agmatine deiminase